MLRIGLGMIIIPPPLQSFIGDQHGLNTLRNLPAKIAAMEPHWDGSKPGGSCCSQFQMSRKSATTFRPLYCTLQTLILTHKIDCKFPGLKDFKPEDRPPVWPVFFAFRMMVGHTFWMILAGLVGGWLWWRGQLFQWRWFLGPARLV